MVKIRFTDRNLIEEGLRTIITSGMVVYTGQRGVYKVPYERVNEEMKRCLSVFS